MGVRWTRSKKAARGLRPPQRGAPALPAAPLPVEEGAERWLVIGALAVYLTLVLRTAWVTDDAFISLRTVDNFLHGYGLRWNVSERVQTYTHPLWLFALIGVNALWRDPFYSTVALSVTTAAAAVALLAFGLGRTAVQAVFAVTMLALSKAFVDFSTSGLENPLSHLLLGAFAWIYLTPARLPAFLARRPVFTLALVAGLAVLNRQDTGLVVLPGLVHVAVRSTRERGLRATLAELGLGFAPFGAWLCFSLFYYGFPFPNTAYAKLSTGIEGSRLREQGVIYLLNTVVWDPALVALLVIGSCLGFSSSDPKQRWFTLGALLYLAYVVNVGGDFMAGRFLTVPAYALACVLAVRPVLPARPVHVLSLALPFVLLFVVEAGTEAWPVVGKDVKGSGVIDERIFYRNHASLMLAARNKELPAQAWMRDGRDDARRGVKFRESGTVGYRGYFAGPSVHYIDHYALADPLLSHLRVADPRGFRIGHFRRRLPRGYRATLQGGSCRMSRELCRYYAELTLLTRAPLLSWPRIAAIARMNLGLDDGLLRQMAPDDEGDEPQRHKKSDKRGPAGADTEATRDDDDDDDDDASESKDATKAVNHGAQPAPSAGE
jgi:arabinofuranosyltransferase